MTDTLERIITTSGNVFGIACDTTALANEACRRHDLGPTAAAALGRTLTGAVLLAALMKGDQSVQLIFEGNGPLGKVVAEAGNSGWARGYVLSPHADVPLKNGLIDVSGGIGKAGFLRVTKDIGGKGKYTGLVQLLTSEVGEDIAYYLTESEQTPSAVSLGVHLQPDGTIAAAGGYLIQSLPPADIRVVHDLEKQIEKLGPITTLLRSGKTPAVILSELFGSIPHKRTGSQQLNFKCNCSSEKMEQVLHTLNSEDLEYLIKQEEEIEVKCDYCSNRYAFPKEFLRANFLKKE